MSNFHPMHSRIIFLALLSLLPWITSYAASSASTKIDAYCGPAPLKACEEMMPPLLLSLKKRVKDEVEAVYKGKFLNPTSMSLTAFPEIKIQVPICNPMNTVLGTGSAELSENHLTQSCGSECKFNCGRAADRAVECSMNVNTCARERAWTRGALIQSVWKKLEEVSDELKSSGALNLGNKCSPLARDPQYGALLKELPLAIKAWDEVNQGREISCETMPSADSPTPPEEAGCSLSSARKALETVIAHLAVCEIFARAEDSWDQKLVSYLNSFTAAAAAVQQKCIEEEGANPDPADFKACVARKYGPLMQLKFLEATSALKERAER